MRRRRAWTAAIAIAIVLVASLAFARPGGGHSYGGGGGGGGGSGGGGGGGGDGLGIIFELLFHLIFAVPEVGIPLLILVVAILWWRARQNLQEQGWDASPDYGAHRWEAPQPSQTENPRRTLERLRETDPDFSLIVFEDFLHAFWGELLIAQGSRRVDVLMPWLAKTALDNLPSAGFAEEVTTPIVGTISYREVQLDRHRVVVRVTIEGMYSAKLDARHGDEVRSFWVRDHWRLERARDAKSRTPDRVAVFTCPSCGAPAENARTGRCNYCNQVVNDGRFDWVLTNAQRVASEQKPPQLTGDVAESGTQRPTIKAPDIAEQLDVLQRDANLSLESFQGRLKLCFSELQVGWRERDLARIRPWVTDRQLESMRWWLEAYRAAGLRNVSTNSITHVEPVRITRDRWYDAMTVRVYATGTDYTINERGTVVSGSESEPRPFTEYWTMIRGRTASGPPRAEKTCPRCGAPLAIDMAGSCTHCGAHVVSGDFDWVLSRIEQDDAYSG